MVSKIFRLINEAKKIKQITMKKIFTLIAASLFTTLLFAADRKPIVTLNSSRGYEVVIDGRSYFSDYGTINLSNIGFGQHMIKVFEVSRGYRFMKTKRPLAVSSFSVRNNNVSITIGFRGQIMIKESRMQEVWGRDDRDHDRNNGYENDKKDQDRNGYDNGQIDNRDQGNKGNDKPRRF